LADPTALRESSATTCVRLKCVCNHRRLPVAMRLTISLALSATMAACSAPDSGLVLLTRDGCVQADTMRERLGAALVKAGWPESFRVIDVATLKEGDSRSGYPTPTLLFHDRDVFPRETPPPSFAEPT